jgi:hypothetical protein
MRLINPAALMGPWPELQYASRNVLSLQQFRVFRVRDPAGIMHRGFHPYRQSASSHKPVFRGGCFEIEYGAAGTETALRNFAQ